MGEELRAERAEPSTAFVACGTRFSLATNRTRHGWG